MSDTGKSLSRIFRVNVRRRLSEQGWKHYQLAAALDISPPAVSQLLNSEKSPGLPTVEKVAKALECTALSLLTEMSAEESEKNYAESSKDRVAIT